MKYKVIKTDNAPSPIGPYSQAREFNGLVFISGQIAIDPQTGTMKSEDVIVETVQVMKNLRAVLAECKLSFEDVLKSTIYLADFGDFEKVNQVYAEYFKEYFPARETVQVSKLPKNARVEISMIAGRA